MPCWMLMYRRWRWHKMSDHWIYDDLSKRHQVALEQTIMECKEAARLLVDEHPVVASVLRDKALQLENTFGLEVTPKDA